MKNLSETGRKSFEKQHIIELFVLFYLGILLSQIFRGYFEHSNLMSMLLTGVDRVCSAGMIFAAGCLIGAEDKKHPDFQKNILNMAKTSIILFWGIGFLSELIVYKRDVFWIIKNLLSVMAMPHHAAIFFTLTVLFLLCYFFWPSIEKWMENYVYALIISIVGFFCTFIPEEYIGYALTGVFVGADKYHCVALFPHLAFFFMGILFVSKRQELMEDETLNSFYKSYMITAVMLFILGAIFFVLGFKPSAWLMFGGGGAVICVRIAEWIPPFYDKVILFWKKVCYQKIKSKIKVTKEKKQKSRKYDLFMYYVGYTLLFAIVGYLIFYPYLFNGRVIIWKADALGQYLPKVYRFMEYAPSILKDLLHGNLDFIQYDFRTGLGSTVTFSYDPIYWLYLFFKPSQIEGAYSAMILFRYYLIGISMSALLLYFKKSHYVTYIASITYTFCGYAIFAGTRHGQFLTPLILIPLLVIGMEKIIRERKWYLWTVLMAVSLLCSYYFLYMNIIALGIYYLLRIITTEEYRNIKVFLNRSRIIIGSSLLGFSMGCISLATSFGSYVESSRSGGNSLASFITKTPLFYREGWILDYFMSFLSDSYSSGLWFKIGLPPLALLSLILLFTRKNKKEWKWMYLILTVFCMFPVFGYIMNGFSNVSNRWCYIYVFVIVMIFAENIGWFQKLETKEIRLIFMLATLYFGTIFFSRPYRKVSIFWMFSLLMITILFLVILNMNQKKISKRVVNTGIFVLTIGTVILNANVLVNSNTFMGEFTKKGASLYEMSRTAFQHIEDMKQELNLDDDKEPFYRSTNIYSYADVRSTSIIYDYNDIATFNSTLNGGIVDYNRKMGNTDWTLVTVQDYNMRTKMNALASVRFMATSDRLKYPMPYGYKKVFEKDGPDRLYSVYENQYALPLGYTYNTVTSESDADALSAVEKESLTMQSAIVEDEVAQDNEKTVSVSQITLDAKRLDNVKITANDEVAIEAGNDAAVESDGKTQVLKGDGYEITSKVPVVEEDAASGTADEEDQGTETEEETNHKNRIISKSSDAKLSFDFEGEPNSETYIVFKGDIEAEKDAREHFITINTVTDDLNQHYQFRVDAYATGQEERVFNLGYHKEAITHVEWEFGRDGTLSFDDIAIYTQTMDTYPERIQNLSRNVLENARAEKNTVTGTIQADRDEVLVISLPYQSGWEAYVDGEKVELFRANYQYMAMNIREGKHEITLQYHIPAMKAVLLITVGGFLLFIVIILFNIIRKRKQK